VRILMLAGGDSDEREVSLNSGRAVYESLTQLGHTVIAVDPASGRLLTSADGHYLLKAGESPSQLEVVQSSGEGLRHALAQNSSKSPDVVFLTLHGGAGENGSLQCLLDMAGMKYTGSGMLASAIAMDKEKSKRLFESVGVATPKWALYRAWEWERTNIPEDIISRLPLPVIVKPNDGGSSVGMSRVNNDAEIPPAIERCFKASPNMLVEEYIAGRELTVAVIDDRVFPIVEITPKDGLYDYKAKYTKGGSNYTCPAKLDADIAESIQQSARKCYDVMGACGLARIDFMLAPDNNYYCLEVNTLPGMTNLSLAPMAAQAGGLSFEQLVDAMIQSALKER
jgi:D-alanine-D-alanine ligase